MNFFSYEYDPNVKFDMYTPMHLIMLGLFILIVVLFFVFKKRIYNSPKEQLIRYIYGGFLTVNLILLIIIEYTAGHVYLPFHLCSISYILTIVLLFTKNKKIWYFVFFTGIIGGIVSFAIPDLYHAGYNRFRFYEFIIAHSAIIIVPIYFLTEYKWKITSKVTFITILITNVLGFGMWPINLFLRNNNIIEDANFMFSLGPPEDVESVFGSYPWHFFTFELVLLITMFGLYYIASLYQNKQKAA